LIRISINTNSGNYDALIENGLLRSCGSYIRELLPEGKKYFIVTVAPVRKHLGKVVDDAFIDAELDHQFIEIQDGERHKNLKTVEDLCGKLVKLGADRGSVVVALGGGVVGDISGFAASIYMRGIRFLQMPTTFLAQIDSSVGGKTGVNLAEGKNLVGTFNQPELVLIDPQSLETLPDREFRSGLFEALKAGIIRSPRIFGFMEENRERILARDFASLEWLIAECVRVKGAVVSEDEREHGVRRILNLGHTMGHALESETGYKHFLHGEAVGWGMIAAAMISVGMQKTTPETAQRIISAILAYATLPKVEVRPRSILRRLTSDKKTIDGKVHFILPTEVGRVEIVNDVPEKAVLQAVEELRYLSQA